MTHPTPTREAGRSTTDGNATDFLAAFAIGAALGAGAVLLLRPSRRPTYVRVARGVKVRGVEVRGGARRLQQPDRGMTSAARGLADQGATAGGSAATRLRDEIATAVNTARREIVRAIGEQVADATKTLERSAQRLRRS